MPLIDCPGCKAQLRVKDEYAGKTMKCPRCTAKFEVPRTEEEVPVLESVTEAPARTAPSAPTKACPHCGERISVNAKKCRFCKEWVEEEEDEEEDDDVSRPRFKKCPKCGGRDAERVLWTPWGSFYGPAMLSHVKCPDCGYAYNGRTGGSNLIPAIIFVSVPLLLIVAILGGLAYMILSM